MSMYQFANVDTEYSPIPFMEVHGLLDEAVHYGSTAEDCLFFAAYNIEYGLELWRLIL